MSSMMEQTPMDPNGQNGVTQISPSAPMQRIKCLGARPVVFEGSELGMAMSFTPSLPYWYETNIYRTSDQRFVACVKLFYVSKDEENTAQAWECASLDEAIDKLTAYDAADDVRLTLGAGAADLSAAEMAAYSMELRAQAKSYRHHYASLIGEFLLDLEGGA